MLTVPNVIKSTVISSGTMFPTKLWKNVHSVLMTYDVS